MSSAHTAALALLISACDLGIIEPKDESAPSLTETAPEDGATALSDQAVTFSATVTDGDDAIVRVSVKIASDLDGTICNRAPGTTGEVSCDAVLSVGTHQITFTATDQADKTDEVTASLVVLPGGDTGDTGDTGVIFVDLDDDGYSADVDCDDLDAEVYPGAEEVCDGVDNDCDEDIDEGVTGTWYADGDSDGYGDPDVTADACSAPSGYVDDSTDCDDLRDDVYPGAPEVSDGVDNDCDEVVDELDGTWTGTLTGSVAGTDEGTCEGSVTLIVDQDAATVVSGSGGCAAGLLESLVFTGDLAEKGATADGALTAVVAGDAEGTGSWSGGFAKDTFTGSLSGSASDKDGAWSFDGTLSLTR